MWHYANFFANIQLNQFIEHHKAWDIHSILKDTYPSELAKNLNEQFRENFYLLSGDDKILIEVNEDTDDVEDMQPLLKKTAYSAMDKTIDELGLSPAISSALKNSTYKNTIENNLINLHFKIIETLEGEEEIYLGLT